MLRLAKVACAALRLPTASTAWTLETVSESQGETAIDGLGSTGGGAPVILREPVQLGFT